MKRNPQKHRRQKDPQNYKPFSILGKNSGVRENSMKPRKPDGKSGSKFEKTDWTTQLKI